MLETLLRLGAPAESVALAGMSIVPCGHVGGHERELWVVTEPHIEVHAGCGSVATSHSQLPLRRAFQQLILETGPYVAAAHGGLPLPRVPHSTRCKRRPDGRPLLTPGVIARSLTSPHRQ